MPRLIAALAALLATSALARTPTPNALAGPFWVSIDGGEKKLVRLWVQSSNSAAFDLGGGRQKVTFITKDVTVKDPTTNQPVTVKAVTNLKASGNAGDIAGAATLDLAVTDRNNLQGTLNGSKKITFARATLIPPSASEMAEFDAGPPPAMQAHLDAVPDYAAVNNGTYKKWFWSNFHPTFYRGRLDGSAKIMLVASDPGPTECLPFVHRTLVGDAGQKVQGLLTKIGLDRSYVAVNAFAFALHPTHAQEAGPALQDPTIKAWRNKFYDMVVSKNVKVIVSFGSEASQAIKLWDTRPKNIPIVYLPHPSAHDPLMLVNAWRDGVPRLRRLVPPDAGIDPNKIPNYGAAFTENDLTRIPRRDLPKEAPLFAGDDSWGRAAEPIHNNFAERPAPDDQRSLIWTGPDGKKNRWYAPDWRKAKTAAAPQH